jgi:hypothetical protein
MNKIKVYIGKELLFQETFLLFQVFSSLISYNALCNIYLMPIFFKEGCLFFNHQWTVLSLRNKPYFIVFSDTVKSIFNLFYFFQEYRFFSYGHFLDFISNDYIIPKLVVSQKEHFYVELFIKTTTKMLWERKEELSTFQYLFVLIFKVNSSFRTFFEPLDFTIKGKVGFFINWINMNIKLFPFLFLLFLTGVPFGSVLLKPLSFLEVSLSTRITPSLVLFLILAFYIIKVYGILIVRIFINLRQAFHIENIWQSYKYAWKLPFLISLSFYCLFFFMDKLAFLHFPFFIILFIFSNLRFFVFSFIFPYFVRFAFPFTRSISNFFQKQIDKEDRKSSELFRIFSEFYGEATVIQYHAYLSYYEQFFQENFLYIFCYFWFILVPKRILLDLKVVFSYLIDKIKFFG